MRPSGHVRFSPAAGLGIGWRLGLGPRRRLGLVAARSPTGTGSVSGFGRRRRGHLGLLAVGFSVRAREVGVRGDGGVSKLFLRRAVMALDPVARRRWPRPRARGAVGARRHF